MKNSFLKASLSTVLTLSMVLASGFMCFADEAEEVPEETDDLIEAVSEEDEQVTEELDEPELIFEETEDIEEVLFEEDIEFSEDEEEIDVTEDETEDVLASGDVSINKTNFPDSDFRSFVSDNFDQNDDGVLSKSEADAVMSMNVQDKGITDLKGIGNFKNLLALDCSDNELRSLDISSNTKLRILTAENNKLTSLTVSSNPWLCIAYQHGLHSDSDGMALYYLHADSSTIVGLLIDSGVSITAKRDSELGLGWKKSANGKWWYKFPDDKYAYGTVYTFDNEYYYFDEDGYMVTGWIDLNSSWIYAGSSGKILYGWQKISNKWYYLGQKSAPFMATGVRTIDGKNYYFNDNGVMQTGWAQLYGNWYYFNTSGEMVYGWKKISGKWYYFDSLGVMKTGWLKLSGKWYYFKTSGQMVTGSLKIGDKTYNFDSSGVCLNP